MQMSIPFFPQTLFYQIFYLSLLYFIIVYNAALLLWITIIYVFVFSLKVNSLVNMSCEHAPKENNSLDV